MTMKELKSNLNTLENIGLIVQDENLDYEIVYSSRRTDDNDDSKENSSEERIEKNIKNIKNIKKRNKKNKNQLNKSCDALIYF